MEKTCLEAFISTMSELLIPATHDPSCLSNILIRAGNQSTLGFGQDFLDLSTGKDALLNKGVQQGADNSSPQR